MNAPKEIRNEAIRKSFLKTKNLSATSREFNLAVSTVYEIIYRKRGKNPLVVKSVLDKKLSTS